VGALFRGARCIHINHVCFHTPTRRRGVGTSSLWAESTHSMSIDTFLKK
jgi:hypothetical protein